MFAYRNEKAQFMGVLMCFTNGGLKESCLFTRVLRELPLLVTTDTRLNIKKSVSLLNSLIKMHCMKYVMLLIMVSEVW